MNSNKVAERRESHSRPQSHCPVGRHGKKVGECFECRIRELDCRSGEDLDTDRRDEIPRRTIRHIGPSANEVMPLAMGGYFGDTRGSYELAVGTLD